MTTVYRFIHDPGHGWLEVWLNDLGQLGLIDKVTAFSHMSDDRQKIYLEEDCDAPLFLEAKGINAQVWHDWVNKDSFIRGLDTYDLKLA